MMKKPLLCSFASGCVWIGVASSIAYAASPIHTAPLDVARTFAGGIVSAPLIGLLVGHIARRFSNVSRAQRIWVALGDLYLAAYLFLLATGLGHLVKDLIARSHVETMQRSLVVDPLLGALLGLTYRICGRATSPLVLQSRIDREGVRFSHRRGWFDPRRPWISLSSSCLESDRAMRILCCDETTAGRAQTA
jgi:hypothetical protein